MSKKTGDYKIPFKDGNQIDYAANSWAYGGWNIPVEMLDNFEFEDELTLQSFGRGRSSITFTLERTNGKKVTMFVSDFYDIAKNSVIENGKIKGRFTFVKKGQNYGCRMIVE